MELAGFITAVINSPLCDYEKQVQHHPVYIYPVYFISSTFTEHDNMTAVL